ncbi:acetate/propionate family kinase [Silvibacterium acidisoli]|uniref:acetate/propionate family kinase n=1 Tax=Acidobacteriaceae bacterium ZG23-2 TaxID=2883246 RepID=UPI00406CF37C
MQILVLNPGGNSLKAEIVSCEPDQTFASAGETRLSVAIEGIGSSPELSLMDDKRIVSKQKIKAEDYGDAAESLLRWYEEQKPDGAPALDDVDCIALRVVHGGDRFDNPVEIDEEVRSAIEDLEKLAPLHNKSSVEVLAPLRRHLACHPVYAVFDNAFHRTMPEHAALYGIPLDLARKHGIRRYGFHGISHRYLLERYAELAKKDPADCSIVSMHLESGCSVTAVRNGRSIDNTMGLTPLEGLMMGTRSGDVDPELVALLMREEKMSIDDVMNLLNKESGLKGVSQVSLDTRVLMKQMDKPQVKLAMEIFSYRVRKAVGAALAAVGDTEAVVFGGGIVENTGYVRKHICDGIRGFGLEMDEAANETIIDKEGLLSTEDSRVAGWVIPTEEAKQMAHEVALLHRNDRPYQDR